ncbi:DUF3450 domain-containing protein [Alteromonas sediminis]|uniref:DUF3450 domain-containing protein n=1 Tax=Alteromonas sediminis TaxID=2259342 RepID=A0A3N5XWK5_9ALTE|nr:DUF3450 domain-containing protein [Alteromonas sediminis]RPJ65052.1 DUF3450 domain-containing protein [Alteromonas sediminis]
MSKRTLIASTVAGVFAFSGSAVASLEELNELHKEQARIQKAAVSSQEKVNALFEQSQDLLVEYRAVVDQSENLKIYNDYLASLVADQQRGIDSLQRQIDSIEATKQGIVPLMFRMIDSLEQFIELDIPINLEERKARVDRLRDLMANSEVTVSEQFRQVIEAYLIENEYGTKIDSYQGSIEANGTEVTVDFFNLGRTALLALSLDQSSAWVFDKATRTYQPLGDEYLSSVVDAVKIANGQIPADLIKLPIAAAE